MSRPARVDGTELRAVQSGAGPLGRLLEPKKGYRFSPENLTLASALADVDSARSVLDLGAGCGVLGLLAAHELDAARVVLCERNPDMAAFSRVNAGTRGADVWQGDLADFASEEPFDFVVTNPPFYPSGHGRASANETTRDATQSLHGGVREFISAASRVLSESGTVVVLYPADGLSEVLVGAAENGLLCAGLTFVYARHTERPFRVWVRLDRRGAPVVPTLVSPASLRR